MEASSQSRGGVGLWNNPRPARYSRETQDLLRLMMQESRLTNLQRKQINQCLENGGPLPLTPDHTPSASHPQLQKVKPVSKLLPARPQRRSAESCRSGNSYVREKFLPGPIRDSEKEKRRLQNILATGQEEPTAVKFQNPPKSHKPEERDRYQEVLDEIEDRKQFLVDMASLGKERQYIVMINSEISQRLRELEMLDKSRNQKKDEETQEQVHRETDDRRRDSR